MTLPRQGIAVLLLSFLSALGGCDYERITIVTRQRNYDARVLTHYEDVEIRASGIVLKPGARLAIHSSDITSFVGSFDVAILDGDGFNAYLRSVPHLFDTTKGLAILYSRKGCSVTMPDGEVVPLERKAEMGARRLLLTNEAGVVGVSIGCDRLFESYTGIPNTEYVIFEALPGSTVELRTVAFSASDGE